MWAVAQCKARFAGAKSSRFWAGGESAKKPSCPADDRKWGKQQGVMEGKRTEKTPGSQFLLGYRPTNSLWRFKDFFSSWYSKEFRSETRWQVTVRWKLLVLYDMFILRSQQDFFADKSSTKVPSAHDYSQSLKRNLVISIQILIIFLPYSCKP